MRFGFVIQKDLNAGRRNHGDRVSKELEGIYHISALLRNGTPLEQILQNLPITIIQSFPDVISSVKVCCDDRVYSHGPHADGPFGQQSDIMVNGKARGRIEVAFCNNPGVLDCDADRPEQAYFDDLSLRIGEAFERASAEAKTRCSAAMLSSVRNINRAAVRGEDPVNLIETVCRELVSSGNLSAAWVYLNHREPCGQQAIEHGWGNASHLLFEKMSTGWLPLCCRRALSENRIIVTRNPVSHCRKCPLADSYNTGSGGSDEALTAAVRMDDKLFGFMCISVAKDAATAKEKESLLKELSDDIAFALRSIESADEHERTEEALKKEAFRRQVLMGVSRDGICIINQEHQVVEANQRFAEMLGYTPEELLSLHTWDFEAVMPESEIRAVFADLTRTSATFETKHRRKDGTVYDAEVSASGTLVGNEPMVFTVSRDITEKRNLQAGLAQSDRLAGMGILAAGVAHEINNPLAYVLYNLESLLEDVPGLAAQTAKYREDTNCIASEATTVDISNMDNQNKRDSSFIMEDLASRFQEVLSGIRRIQSITRSLGTFSRTEEERIVPVDLHYAIECAVNMAFNEIKYRARLMKEFSKLPDILANEGRLSQVFLNLLINAAHAVPEGDMKKNEIRIRTWQEGEEVCVEIRDTGEGIPKENLARIFDPFFTTKSVGVGMGLGLAISRNIVTGYGGRIDVQSEVGKGTSFIVRFPICRPISAQTAEPKAEAMSGPETRGRILVVDDEEGICRALKRILKNHEVVTARTAESAQEILESDQAFDLVLCDVMMPIMSGMDLHHWLTTVSPRLANQFVFISGGAFTPRAGEYLLKVGNRCVEKPFHTSRLRKMVSELIAQYRESSQPEDCS